MSEGIQFLTEKDLEYFQKLAEQGEAVILTISEEDLLSLDFSKPVKSLENEQINTQEELDQWVRQYREEFRRLYGDSQKTVRESQQIREQIEAGETSNEEVQMNQTQEAKQKPSGRETAGTASNLVERLAEVQLDPEKTEIINRAFRSGLNDRTILLLLQDGNTADEMREMCDLFIRNKERS